MMSNAQTKDILSFGPFSLIVSERLLTKQAVPIELGARSLDILIALLSQPNEVISKRELLARVWPDVTVGESSLRFHVASLRKALCDGKDGARYITTLAGRGYCFVAPVSRSTESAPAVAAGAPINASFSHANLPSRLGRMLGREDDIVRVCNQLTAHRFVTIVGTGGVGKTTVAVAVAHALADAFKGAVLFVDLGTLSDPNLVATTVASMMGLSIASVEPTPELIAHLRNKRILLILDTCEHVIDGSAALASQIFISSPQVHILATSREALRVEGEHVYRLDSLACPPDEPGVTAALARTFPAPQLFVERAIASGAQLDMSDADAATVVSICRKLDGVALAIELAARRVEAHGLHQTAFILDQHLTTQFRGPRTAPPRQRTLQATLDWSYGLLTDLERTVIHRLAGFVGHFTLDAALAVVTDERIDQKQVFAAIDSLVAKSMLAAHPIGAMMRYRLLDTTRAHIFSIGIDNAELTSVAVRHATYYRQWLEQRGAEWPTLATGLERAPHFAAINNVRAALEWSFGPNGDAGVGVALAAAAAPVFLAMSLLAECHRWSERAILALDDAARGGIEEMKFQAALGVSLIFTRGGREEARLALMRGLAIAEDRGDILDKVRLSGSLGSFHLRIGECNTALQFAKRCAALAQSTQDSVAIALAHAILGLSLHYAGEVPTARTELEAAIAYGSGPLRSGTIYFGIDGNVLAGAALAMNLWLEGHPAQAAERARKTVQDAVRTDHSLSISTALLGAISVFLWNGDLASAGEQINMLTSRAESYSLGPYLWLARGFKGGLAIRQGDAEGGVELLKSSLEKLHQAPYELFTPRLNISLIQGLSAMGRFAEACALADEAVRLVEAKGNANSLPELLRLKGGLLRSIGGPSAEVETCFAQSLELSRRQGARAWELRTGTDVAVLLADRGERDQARALLQPIFDCFMEGMDTGDLKAALSLLANLG
jgi:predicted ATPase/DNA-binding winged helix-turn-helix (wHTH) protein